MYQRKLQENRLPKLYHFALLLSTQNKYFQQIFSIFCKNVKNLLTNNKIYCIMASGTEIWRRIETR